MAEDKLLTIRDVSLILGISEKEVVDLAQEGRLPAYKVGGIYLRFRREQIEAFKKSSKAFTPLDKSASQDRHYLTGFTHKTAPSGKYSFKDRVGDFLYFNDFYILSVLLILLMLIIIFQGY